MIWQLTPVGLPRVVVRNVTNPRNDNLHDMTPVKLLTSAPLVIIAFWIAYPKPFRFGGTVRIRSFHVRGKDYPRVSL